jgi:hypothetical protein
MAHRFHLMEQAERCRRLARDSTDRELSDHLFRLGDEYAARANADQEGEANGQAPLGGLDGRRQA